MNARGKPLALTVAEYNLTVLRTQWAAHLKLCRECVPLTSSRNRYCPEGWEIVKQAASETGKIRELTQPSGDTQDTLF